MSSHLSRGLFAWTAILGISLITSATYAQKAVIGQGDVIADDVYVRSGPTMNHYTICKVQAGTRVKFVGQRGAWREILPPAGAFSLISGDYVDVGSSGTGRGVVNGNNVRVRAGSSLNDSKYTVQTKLKKGDEVTVLGRNPDGFLRIVPPPGATLWIHGDFVTEASGAEPSDRRSPPQRTDDGQPVETDVRKTGQVHSDPSTNIGPADETTSSPAATSATAAATPHGEALAAIDEAVRKELSKPAIKRNLKPFIDRYEPLAEQTSDQVAQTYAQARIDQLSYMVRVIDALKTMQSLSEQAELTRRQFSMDRILPVEPLARAGLDAKGVLRTSALYPPNVLPRKLRLADSDAVNARTIGYVEIPTGAGIDVDAFLGRYVGLRAASTHLQEGMVKPVPVYIASELVLLQPGEIEEITESRKKG